MNVISKAAKDQKISKSNENLPLKNYQTQNINSKAGKAPDTTKQAAKQKQSYWSMLIKGIVRPPRANYRPSQLGTRQFTYHDVIYSRIQEQVKHNEKQIIELTILKPQNANSWVILYLHGNSSSKMQAVSLLNWLPRGFSLACFDFLGCGKNQEEDSVTLGARQSKQVGTVVEFLEKQNQRVVLWGRSMGAASALKYGQAQVIVADSSFKSLKSLCKQVAKANSPKYIPNCFVNCLFPCVFFKLKNDVKEKANYDVQQLDIVNAVKSIDPNSMVIFMSGDKDTLIHHRNSEKLFKHFTGQNKHIEIFSGTHNTKRPQQVMKKVMFLIEDYAMTHKELVPKIPNESVLKIKKQSKSTENQVESSNL